tara:strand:- start:3972 stop:4526 length:555 start_codon:yes stop_codon:yes gene_type:complete
MPKKIFVEDESKVEENVELVVVEPKPKKERKKRAPLTDEQKAKLVERLAKARAAKKNAKKPPVKEKKEVVVEEEEKPKPKRKPRAPKQDDNYIRQQAELNDYRHQLELQKIKNELDIARSSKKKSVAQVKIIDEPVDEFEDVDIEDEPPIDKTEPIIDNTPSPPKSRTKNIANSGNIWDMIRQS